MKGTTPWCVAQAWKRPRRERRPITVQGRRWGNLWGCRACRNAVRRLPKWRIDASWEDIHRRRVSAYRQLAKSSRNNDRSGRMFSMAGQELTNIHCIPLSVLISSKWIYTCLCHLIFYSRFQLCQQVSLHCDPLWSLMYPNLFCHQPYKKFLSPNRIKQMSCKSMQNSMCQVLVDPHRLQVLHFRRLKKSFVTRVSKYVYTVWVHSILQNVCLNCGILLCFA